MSKLMIILGIIVAAAGAVIGALIYVSPGQMQVLGLTPEVAAVLLVGGLGLVGLGGVIGAMDKTAAATRDLRAWLSGQDAGQAPAVAAATTISEFSEVTDSPPPFPVPTPVVEPASSVSKIDALIEESKAETSRAVAESKETIAAMDKAKDELNDVLGVTEPEPPAPPPPVEEPPAEEAEVEDTQLFVVEERLIRGRPARVLSDGTVEAETDDGWMRFENLEHLEEYLDAMSPGQS
ncbi:hypothetical protein [Taklimakanibacter lacteus]|uniref:hypothetical protein n=1 Tax=Taklimakanibacter lacteus TaxID=2268456 RepID=UPI000E65F854